MNQPTPAPLPGGELKSPPATKLPSSEGLGVGSWAHSGFSKTSELPMNLLTDLVGPRCRAALKSGLRGSTAPP